MMKKTPWLIALVLLLLLPCSSSAQEPPVVVYQPNLLNGVSVTTASALVSPIAPWQRDFGALWTIGCASPLSRTSTDPESP